MNRALVTIVVVLGLTACLGEGARETSVSVPGEDDVPRSFMVHLASLIQEPAPLENFDLYLVGLHPLAETPRIQLEAHHYCHRLNADFWQCLLFDGNTPGATLTGIEYMISRRLYQELPRNEKGWWHPHNGEILSGQLVAPGIPPAAEHEVMESLLNSYGKTWHTWLASQRGPLDALPYGPPKLAWSFSNYDEAREELIRDRNEAMHLNAGAREEARRDLLPEARPQAGTGVLRQHFEEEAAPLPGVAPLEERETAPE